MMSPAEILQLARIYGVLEGITLGTVGMRALNNAKILRRIDAGQSANANSLIKLEDFFRTNWPKGAAWPAEFGPHQDDCVNGRKHPGGGGDGEHGRRRL